MPTVRDLLERLPALALEGDPNTFFSDLYPAGDPVIAGGICVLKGPALIPEDVTALLCRAEVALPDTRARAVLRAAGTDELEQVRLEALRLLAREGRPALAVTRHLLAALASAKPERELVARLFDLTGVPAAVYAPWGELLAGAGPRGWPHTPPFGPEWHSLERGGYRLVAHADLSSALLPWALEVLGVAALRAAADSARLAGQGEALLAELLTGAGGADLGARLEGLGFEGSEFAVAVAELHGVQPRTPRGRARLTEALLTLRTAGDAFFARRGHRALSALRGGRVVWLWSSGRPETQRAALLAALLAASEADVRLGLSDPHARWQDAPQAQRQAVLALQATRFPRSSQSFSLLDPVHWVLSAQPAENLEALARTVLEPLRQADASGKLLQTLRLYLQDTHDLPALAERLHIHLNTLRYRLARIEQILGQPLSHPATLVRLYLAVQAEQGRGAS